MLVSTIPCQKAPAVPPLTYSWKTCNLNPDNYLNFEGEVLYFGYTKSLAETYILVLTLAFLIPFGALNLKIGRKKRKSEIDNGKKCDRPPMGKKGLGKLAFFGIAERAVIETIQDRKKVTFEMDWQAIQKVPEEESYNPVFKEEDTDEKNGTTVILTKMYKKTNFDIDALKKSISNYFIFDDDFKVLIKEDSDEEFLEIDNELRYQVKDKKQEFAHQAKIYAEGKGILTRETIKSYNNFQKEQKLGEMLYEIEPDLHLLPKRSSLINYLNHLTEKEKEWPIGDKRIRNLKEAMSYAIREKIA